MQHRARLAHPSLPEAEIIYTKARNVSVEAGCFVVRSASKPGNGGIGPPATLDRLTVSEQAVTDLVAAGRSNDEVAATLGLSVHTVRSHLRSVFPKLGVASRSELAALINAGRH